MGRFGRIALKTILWIIASILFLVVLVAGLIQVPGVQNFVKDKAVNFLQNKIHTKVQIAHISLGIPKLLVLEGVYFEDQKKDTLIAGDKLKVDISMLKLLHNQVEINEIDLEGITAKVSRGADSVFNFDYIIKAFAGEQKKQPKPEDTTSSMKFSVEKVNLDRINISYKDVTTGNDVRFLLGHFDTRIKDFDLDKMKFTIPKITLSGFNARIIQTPVGSSVAQAAVVDTTTKPMNLALTLGTIDISKIKLDYQSPEMATKLDLGKLLVEMDKIDLKNQRVGIKSIELNDTYTGLTLAKPQTVVKAAVKTVKKLDTLVAAPQTTKGWAVLLTSLKLNNDHIQFNNQVQKPLPRGLDFGHMDLRNLNTELENLSYKTDTISGKINNLSFDEKSGLRIKQFRTDFYYGPKNAYLNGLYLETPNTVLQKSVQVSYPSLDAITKNIGLLSVNANLDGSHLNLKDVLLLMPTMASMEPFHSHPNSSFKINGHVVGKVNDLRISGVEISGLTETHIKASGTLKGLPDVNKAYFDLNIADFNTSRNDIAMVVPKGTIPSNISIPAFLDLKGSFKGGMKDFSTKMNLHSSYGNIDLNAIFHGARKGHESYVADVKMNDVNVGALTKQPQMVGKVTLAANVKGNGIDPKHISLQFNGNIASAYVKGYTYKNLQLKGSATDGSYVASARMADPNIHFSLDAKANMNKKYPSVNATLMLDSINLQKLNFVKDDMRLHGKLVADVPTADPDYLNGNIKLTDLVATNKGQRIKIDTISLVSTATADSSSLRLHTPVLNARLSGKYQLTKIGPAVQDVINKYYNTDMAGGATATARAKIDSTKRAHIKAGKPVKAAYSPQQFTFDARLTKTPLLEQFVPDLKQLDPVNLNGKFDSQTGELTVNASAPKIIYATNTVNNVKFNVNTNNNALNYALTVDEVKVGTSFDILYPSVTGKAQDNKLNLSLQVRDAKRKERYRIAGVFTAMQSEYQFSFLRDGLMLDYTPWTVNPNNAFQFGGRGILARDFTISNSNQILSVNSSSQEFNSPLTVAFTNFHIETLTKIAQQDSLQVGGVINGKANISNFQASPVFVADMNVGDFSFKGDTVGNIALKVNNQTANAYSANVAITGKGNQVTLDGMYYTTPESRMDLTLNIGTLNMKSIEGFSFGNIRKASGTISGALKITGSPSAPAVRGDVKFKEVGFNVSMLNSYFRMPNESIAFNDEGIRFNNFTMVDSVGNKAVVTGAVYTKTFTDFRFGLDIRTNNFQVMNSGAADNKLYYGKLYLDSHITIKGDMKKPVVDADITVNDKTDLTIVLPSDDPAIEDRTGVVTFGSINPRAEDSILLAKQLDSLKKSEVTGMDVSATLKVDKNANFNIVIDPRNGDIVHIKGEAQLNAAIDPSGKINLTGTYTVNKGSYNLNYATVSRRFDFKPGSTITWTGDPTTADINLTAIYVAKVPPIDLVDDYSNDETQRTMLKEKLPFNVNLNLKNELMKPDIGFDIVLPDSSLTVSADVVDAVQTRLTQIRRDPNEMNKQVLGVLVLGHFIGDNPLQSQGPSAGVEGTIRNSVSSLLSDQLNKLAGNLIEGVDLSFDLQSGEDYSTGVAQNRTDLNVGLSKRFLNDRLTVTVGNNFNLEGQNQPGQKATNIAGNVSVGYKLSKDGRYMLRAYRKDEYIVIQGQVIETGVAFSVTLDYNRFSQIFRKRTAEERAMRKQAKEQNKADKEKEKQQKDQDEKQRQKDQQATGVITTQLSEEERLHNEEIFQSEEQHPLESDTLDSDQDIITSN